MEILLTGFEPWGRRRRNPSGEVARALGGHVLPTRYDAAAREVVALAARLRPRAIVMLGLGPGRRKIGLEAVALNVDHCEERAWRRWRRPILRGRPFVLESRLPLDRLYRRLKAARMPVALSYHAGTFVCNQVFYVALARTRVPCGFVHVPPARVLPVARQIRAVRIILDSL